MNLIYFEIELYPEVRKNRMMAYKNGNITAIKPVLNGTLDHIMDVYEEIVSEIEERDKVTISTSIYHNGVPLRNQMLASELLWCSYNWQAELLYPTEINDIIPFQ